MLKVSGAPNEFAMFCWQLFPPEFYTKHREALKQRYFSRLQAGSQRFATKSFAEFEEEMALGCIFFLAMGAGAEDTFDMSGTPEKVAERKKSMHQGFSALAKIAELEGSCAVFERWERRELISQVRSGGAASSAPRATEGV